MSDRPTDRDDELLGRILRDEADAVHPSPDWDDVRSRAGRPRRRWWIPAAAALAVLALVAVGVLALGGEDDDRGVIADDRDRTTTTVGETTTTTQTTTSTSRQGPTTTTTPATGRALTDGPVVGPFALPAGAPLGEGEMVAAVLVPAQEFQEMSIVVLSVETGDVVRTIADGYSTVEGGVYGLTLSPDRRSLLFTYSTSACTSRLEAVPVDGSSAPVVLREDANRVAFSADGDLLAIETGDACVSPATIELAPVAGGETRRYTTEAPTSTTLDSMAFSGSGDLLFVLAGEAGRRDGLRILDLDTGTEHVADQDAGTSYRGLRAAPDGRVTALESCCDEQGTTSTALVSLDGTTVADRLPIDVGDVRTVRWVGLDRTGALVVVEGLNEPVLRIDGRTLRDDVADIAI